MSSSKPSHVTHLRVDEQWLERWTEPVLEPDLPIIDPHHHLWDRPGWPYLVDHFLADLATGHDVRSTVFVQCRAMYRVDGPEALRPVGETEFVVAVAEDSDRRRGNSVRLCEGIVAHADLRLGEQVLPVLEAQLHAGKGRVKGIRHSTAWDAEPVIVNPELGATPGLLGEPAFRAGFGCLARLGLTYDAWVYHPQIEELVALARAFPSTTIILGHVGGPIGIGRYAQTRQEVLAQWRRSMRLLAGCPNVIVKIGGLAMRISGQDFHLRDQPPSSEAAAAAWEPYFAECIEAFGTKRCMFESNFPVDKASIAYDVLWNAFKRLAADCSDDEKADLFWRTAARTYRLQSLDDSLVGG